MAERGKIFSQRNGVFCTERQGGARWFIPLFFLLCAATLAPAATLELTNGQTIEISSFSRQGKNIAIVTASGTTLALPAERFVSPVERWQQAAKEAEKAGDFEKAKAYLKLLGLWDPTLRDRDREAALVEGEEKLAARRFVQAVRYKDYKAAAEQYKHYMVNKEGGLPAACRDALDAILKEARKADNNGDFDAAETGYRAYLEIVPDAPEPTKAIKALGAKRKEAAYEKRVAEALKEAETGSVSGARASLKELLKERPADSRLSNALNSLDRAAREAKIQRAIDAVRRKFEEGDYDTFAAGYAAIHKAGGDVSGLTPLFKQIQKVRMDFAKEWKPKLQKRKLLPVPCEADPSETYYLILPPEYTGEKPFPIVYVHAPGGARDHGVRNLVESVFKGWIIAQPMNSQNGPWGAIWKAQDNTLIDTTRHLNLDPTRRFAAGMSGGGRASLSLAFRHPGKVNGVIPMGAGWPINTDLQPRSPMAVCIVCGRSDGNMKHDVPDTFRKLRAYNIPTKTLVFEGAHVLPPKDYVAQAFQWLLENAPTQ